KDNFKASYSDFADCIGSAKLINVFGAAALRALDISGLSGLCLVPSHDCPTKHLLLFGVKRHREGGD
ncbi:MAG: hypothetical protein VXW13_09760, partial [SAR324 cluster bacterium]|nr:hypothetical protein [SAR324 cluster bacterium]